MVRKFEARGAQRRMVPASGAKTLPALSRTAVLTFLITMPFASVFQFGLLGNFDSNLALWPFLLLIVLLAPNPLTLRTLLERRPESAILRALLITLILASIFTVINGIELKAQERHDYGLDPFNKSLITAIVPLFIGMLYLLSVTAARGLSASTLQWALNTGFWLMLLYTLLQALSAAIPNALYESMWPWIEGAKDYYGQPYIRLFHRINGPTSEPAELVKLVLLFYLPWIVYPASGKLSVAQLGAAVLIVIGAQSITGLALLAIAIILMMRSGVIPSTFKMYMTVIIMIGALLALMFGVEALSKVLDRVGSLRADTSAQVRAAYNGIALNIVKDNPLLGVGWSNEIFFYPERLRSFSYLWEIQQDIKEGVSLTARSLFLRMLMYTGIPLFMYLIISTFKNLRKNMSGANKLDLNRTRFAFIMFGIGGLLDGGIITSFFMWAATAVPLGVQLRNAYSSSRSPQTATRKFASPARHSRMLV